MAIKLIKCGLQQQEKLEKMLIVLIGGFLIYILKHECHMDDGTVKAIIVVLSAIFGYFRLFSVIIWPFLAKSTSFLLIFLL